jgi:hypothetical protein
MKKAMSFICRIIWFNGLLFLSGCDRGDQVAAVDGVVDKFCIPAAHRVPDVPWVPADPPGTPKGFAFDTCWSADPDVMYVCGFAPSIRGGVVSPRSSFRGWHWKDFSGGTLIRWELSSDGVSLQSHDNGKLLVGSNVTLGGSWYIWRKARPLLQGEKPFLADEDEMLALCRTIDNVVIPHQVGERSIINCDRFVLGKDYLLSYSFESPERIPTGLEAQDAAIFAKLDSWRCER